MSHYIFGPQLVGVILYLAGFIIQRFPPKKINNWYGYRTASSMKDQQSWDEANRYSARLMMRVGLISLITGIIVTTIVNYLLADKKMAEGLMAGITIASAIIPAVLVITSTERHLDKIFNNNEIR